MSAAKCETGWGDGLSSETLPELRDHPTPARRVLRTVRSEPPPPGEGKSRTRLQLKHTSTFSRRNASEVCQKFRPPDNRGRRECRAPGAPAAACAKAESKKAHALVRSHREHPAFPAQWFTAYFVLSPAIGLFCHRRLADTSTRLDASVEASGPHDFAVRLSAVRHKRIRVHRIPPHVRDDRETPLQRGGTGESILLFLPNRQEKF